MGIDYKADNLPIKISYDPFHNETFMAYNLDKEYPIKGARAVLLNNNGMSGCYLEEIR